MARTSVLCCVVALLVASCAHPLEVRTNPTGADVSLKGRTAAGESVGLPGVQTTPARYNLEFAEFQDFDVLLSKQGFMDETVRVTPGVLRTLPRGDDGAYLLDVALKQYREVQKAEVVVDPREGLKVRLMEVRAFPEDIEREGSFASKVLSLGGSLSVTGMTISPDGTQLAFSLLETAKDEKGKQVQMATLRAMGTEGGGISQLTTGSWMDVDPCFSADGKSLFFGSNRLRDNGLDLFAINTGGKQGIATVYQQNDGWSRSPRESKARMLTLSYQPNYFGRPGTPHIWTIGGSSGFPTQLKEGTCPAICPKGDRIAYVGPDEKLWVLELESQRAVQLTSSPHTRENQPSWSPDGEYLVYVSNAGKDSTGQQNNDVWLRRADGTGEPIQLTTNGSDDNSPVVDPSQKWIYFVSNRGFSWGVWRIQWPSTQHASRETLPGETPAGSATEPARTQ